QILSYLPFSSSRALTMPSRQMHRRQSNRFSPSPSSGFDDPTIQIADPSFGTAIQAGYQGPMAADVNPALVGSVNLLRSGSLNFGTKPNYTLPLYYGNSSGNESY